MRERAIINFYWALYWIVHARAKPYVAVSGLIQLDERATPASSSEGAITDPCSMPLSRSLVAITHFMTMLCLTWTKKPDNVNYDLDWKMVAMGLIDNTTSMFQVMAWRREGAKSLPEPIMAKLTDANMCQHEWMRQRSKMCPITQGDTKWEPFSDMFNHIS